MVNKVPKLFILNRNYSSWSMRAWLAMRYLKLNFEVEVLLMGTPEVPDMGTPAADALMRRAGPTSKVPALHVEKPNSGGEIHIVFESLAILEYLAEDYPELWPSDRYDRALARSLASEMATGFSGVRKYHMNIRGRYAFDPELYTADTIKQLARLSSIWEDLRSKQVGKQGDKGFLFGHFTGLDAMYSPLVYRLRSYDLIGKIQGKHAVAYVHHLLNLEELKEWEDLSKLEKEIIPADEMPGYEDRQLANVQ
ncbi:Glutathione S-transferase 8 [Mortierella sp. GBA35]|nr:Glutathione S-transferase 8 [Mortierella sp. AD031]KAF9101443.1 Glutathione S-transferase 8 [Mortierella sp. GBA35]KAG0202141.1 Glutathione S-transferase 8 [Mortierella sp. NVP41]